MDGFQQGIEGGYLLGELRRHIGPLADIGVLERVEFVMRDGRVIEGPGTR